MARKKVVQTDNMTLVSELPDDAIKDITGEDIGTDEVKPKTLSQQQSAALAQIPDEKPSKKDIFEEPKTVVAIDSKVIIDCLNFLKAHKITQNYGSNGNAHTCMLTDINGKSVMPFDELRNKSSVGYGDDQDRALINAVNSYKSTLKTEYSSGGIIKLQYEQPAIPEKIMMPFMQPVESFNAPPVLMPSPKVSLGSLMQFPKYDDCGLLEALRQFIHAEIKAQMKDKEDIKSQIMDLVKKLENL